MKTLYSCLTAFLLVALGAGPLHAQTFAPDEPRLAMDGYANAVAVSDGTVFIGEPDNTYQPGAVYLYRQDGDTWTRTAKINVEGATQNDGFGSALAADGDHLLVGASAQGGTAYLFRQDGDEYEQVAQLTPENAPEEGNFGTGGMALSGNWAMVGAPGASDGDNAGVGAVYIFRRSGDTWQQTDRLTGSAAEQASAFGASLSYADGQLLVGAPGQSQNDQEPPQGQAYLFTREGETWTEAGMVEGPGEGPTGFGTAVSLHGERAFVGAPRQGNETGQVSIFALNEDGWQPAGELRPFDGGQRAFFGMSIAHTRDETWVSAMGAKQMAGRIYAFSEGADGEWMSSRQVVTGEASQDLLGRTLAADGDVAVTGATGAAGGAGAAMIFNAGPDGDWTAQATLQGDRGGLEAVRGEAVDCENGQAGRFGCQDVQLLSFMPIKDLGGERGVNLNDIWGWTDPQTGIEYALVGRTDGMAFVDISDPHNPVYIGELPLTPGDTQPNSWRDAKVYQNHMFVVADNAGEHGMQVFDLTRLREYESDEEPITFDADVIYDQINSAHNIVMNEETGYAYIVGAGGGGQTCGGGLHMVNVQDPLQPSFAGCFADERTGRKGTGYSHDAQCLVYNGPDTDYEGREICFGANETALSIADVTDKENPEALAAAEYPGSAYTHQGWITEDHRYFYVNDELDELSGNTEQTRTLIWDITDLDNPQLVKEYTWGPTSSDHNLYVKGNRMYMSNYASGLRVHDISDPENPREVAHFDTSPAGDDDPAGFTGTWSNYPYFESGTVAVSSIGEGLFLVKPQPAERESL